MLGSAVESGLGRHAVSSPGDRGWQPARLLAVSDCPAHRAYTRVQLATAAGIRSFCVPVAPEAVAGLASTGRDAIVVESYGRAHRAWFRSADGSRLSPAQALADLADCGCIWLAADDQDAAATGPKTA